MAPNRTYAPDDPAWLDQLELPAHVQVWAYGGWRPAWLIGRDHLPRGWHGLVQYQVEDAPETTEWLPADRITAGSRT